MRRAFPSTVYRNSGVATRSCETSPYCQKMKDYSAIPKFLHELETQLGFNRFGGWLRGVY